VLQGEVVPCDDPTFGSVITGCFLKRVEPQPAASDPVWQGRYPSGAIYQKTCPGKPGASGGWMWREGPPESNPTRRAPPSRTSSPEQVARMAVSRLTLQGAAIKIAPPSGVGLVHAPVWLWTEVTPQTWGPVTATASVPGLSVTATARATQILWEMGDGHTVRCSGPGTPYRRDLGVTVSPTCGHVYSRTSTDRPGGRFTITATTTWKVTWTGAGRDGSLTTTRTASTRLRITELHVVT
jgi:hypothetical protein